MSASKKSNPPKFSAKVLLFGEHTILRCSKALAIPFLEKYCYWSWQEKHEDKNLLAFAHYLEQVLPLAFNFDEWKEDINQGLYLHSNIPNGYGLGSSGAVCVAVYHRYKTAEGVMALEADTKAFFAQMESFFHGSSSGTDPLIIYLRQSICLDKEGQYTSVKLPSLNTAYQFFLLDTGQTRKTAPLVRLFTEKYDQQKKFTALVDKYWAKPTDVAIDALLKGRADQLWAAFEAISHFQLNHLKEWVLPSLSKPWKNGLESEDYLLKICGTGGGGYCLGFCKDFELVKSILNESNLVKLDI